MEQICTGPVKNRHKVVSNHLHAKLSQVAQSLLVILNILISGRQTDLNVVINVYTFHHIHVKTCAFNLLADLFNLLHSPHLAGLLMMQRPH